MNLDWMDHAKCVGTPLDMWFPETCGRKATAHPQAYHKLKQSTQRSVKALQMCESCPVRQECADHGKQVGAKYGIWGGVILTGRPKP